MTMDWKKKTLEISDRSRGGLTHADIAKRCGCDRTTITKLATGAIQTPNADIGLKLIELHAELKKPDPHKKKIPGFHARVNNLFLLSHAKVMKNKPSVEAASGTRHVAS